MSAATGPDTVRDPSPRPRPVWLRAIDRLSDVCGVTAALMILVSVLVTCQMIWVRTVQGGSTVWQTELVVYMMIGATCLGLPYVQRVRGHVNVDLLPMMLPVGLRRVLSIVVLAIGIGVVGVMLFYSAELWYVAFDRGWKSETIWGPPIWIPYFALPLGFGLYLLQMAADLFSVAAGLDKPFTTEISN